MSSRRVVIIGGGFGGVTVAQHLERQLSSDIEIVLISSENHFVFTPMLAEAVGRAISPLHVVVVGRQMVRRTTWLTAQVTGIDLQENFVSYVGAGGERATLTYDHLVLACGATVNMNLIPGLAAYAYPIKTLGDAIYLGNDLIMRLEEAAVETDPLRRKRLLTIVIIGGGFSGVEVAGEIAEVAEQTARFYPTLKGEHPRIILLQRGDLLIPELNAASLSKFAADKLRKAGVDVRLNSSAEEITARSVRLTSGELFEAATVVSTVGTSPNPLIQKLDLPLDRGRLVTNPDMSIKGKSNVWAVGDCALIQNAFDKKPSAPTAQFAMRQAKQLAANLARTFKGQPTKPFSFRVLGMLASLGNRKAVAQILGVRISGFIAWMLWRGIYLSKLPSLARKLEVVGDWTWKMLFPPNIVQLPLSRTGATGQARYAAGDFIFHKGDRPGSLFVIQSGTAGVYTDESSNPITVLKAGDHFGGESLTPEGQGPHLISVKAETPLELITLRRDDFRRLAQFDARLRRGLEKSPESLKGYEALMARVRINPTIATIKVSEVMTSPAEPLSPDSPLADAISRFEHGKPCSPVVDEGGQLKGYCGAAELFSALRQLASLETPISDFMRKDPPVVSPDQSIVDAAIIMLREEIEMLSVVDSSRKLLGVVTHLDVILKTNEQLPRNPPVAVIRDSASMR